MFQSSKERFRAWLTRFDDILADHPAEAPTDDERLVHHPHRRPLRWERQRRPGSVAARPAYCISPVRAAPVETRRHEQTPH
jgi:hypothetical protein